VSTQTQTLADFLLARIAEDEAAARAADPSPWQYGDVESVAGGSLYDRDVMIASMLYDAEGEAAGVRRTRPTWQADANGAHIARHDPARVLAECEAKRRIVEAHTPVDYSPLGMESPNACHICGIDAGMGDWEYAKDSYPCLTLRALALPYAGHPDYREGWRP